MIGVVRALGTMLAELRRQRWRVHALDRRGRVLCGVFASTAGLQSDLGGITCRRCQRVLAARRPRADTAQFVIPNL